MRYYSPTWPLPEPSRSGWPLKVKVEIIHVDPLAQLDLASYQGMGSLYARMDDSEVPLMPGEVAAEFTAENRMDRTNLHEEYPSGFVKRRRCAPNTLLALDYPYPEPDARPYTIAVNL
jgi:hypothetical protein